ncbi:MAG: hypothetical protein Q9216_006669, partial [Gyalolechia sp. 2 TL-2023]
CRMTNMRRFHLPLPALRAWAHLNNVQRNGVTFGPVYSDERGLGIKATNEQTEDDATLLKVPPSLILSLENVWVYAKSDPQLKQVLDAVGEYAQTARGAILIFLLMQITYSTYEEYEKIGVSNPLAEYIRFLPHEIPLPTFWSEDERALLAGTSLEAALYTKLKSLEREYTHLRDSTRRIEWCQSHWWNDGPESFHLNDWKRLDAMYRSRALDLPGIGHAMVPCIDMANHASGDDTVALYDTDTDDTAVLVLRKGKALKAGEEVTITYGDEKGACEMVFSYGFIEDSMTSARELFLDLDIPEDDPLRLAKKAASKAAPGFKIFAKDYSTDWEGDFVWLVCVNEEDGLDFRLLQTVNGEKELKVFWKDDEVSDISKLRDLLEQERLWEVFQLRAIATLQSRVEEQLLALDRSKANLIAMMQKFDKSNPLRTAMKLRDLEEKLMLHAYENFEAKKIEHLESKVVQDYLESLEERVRSLEQEVRELKDLLDEKDEKIDILSRIHSTSPATRTTSSERSPSSVDEKTSDKHEAPPEDTFRVQQSPSLLDGEADSYFMGASSGRAFIDTFKTKVQESGKPCSDFETSSFFAPCKSPTSSPKGSSPKAAGTKTPPRLVSDQMINIFFQEWAPLFPILHRPTFLKLYTEYVAGPEHMSDQHAVAQLNLVFGIAALSAEARSSLWNKQNVESFEWQWREAIEVVLTENTLATLQCLVLAQLYCIAKADYNRLSHYKGMAISLSHRLGLHQSQERFSLGALTSETRKRVFWALYTLDCFSAALLGLPKLLNEDDIHAEYPVDIDDENVSERGFQSTLPGESTRLSSALALFRGSRILAKVLDELYPASVSYELSLQKMSALNDELDVWQGSLPAHLRLQFIQDKPSTNVVGSRSPFLSLTYQYIRTLIHRPAVGSNLGAKASSSIVALANASKRTIQIIQLLEERRMSFSFCLNKNELLLLSGFGLLFQGLDLNRKGKLMQDSQRLVCSMMTILQRNAAFGSAEFQRVACAMVRVEKSSRPMQAVKASSHTWNKSDGAMEVPRTKAKTARKQLQAMASRFSTSNISAVKKENLVERRVTAPTSSARDNQFARDDTQLSVSPANSEPIRSQPHDLGRKRNTSMAAGMFDVPNLDYLSFGDDGGPIPSYPSTGGGNATKGPPGDEGTGCLSSPSLSVPLDNFFASTDAPGPCIAPSPSTAQFDWGADLWTLPADGNGQAGAQSVLSFTEEELTSGEEWSIHDGGSDFREMPIAHTDGFGLEAFDEHFGV